MTGPDDTDATLALLRRHREGDEQALGALIARDLDHLSDYVRRRLRDVVRRRDDTNDVVNETVVRILGSSRRYCYDFESKDMFRRFVGRVAVRRLRSRARCYHRDAEWQREVDSIASAGDGSPAAAEVVADRDADRRERSLFAMAYELLEPEDRELVALRHLEERPIAEIAALLGIEPAAARMRCHRALARCKSLVRRLRAGRLDSILDAAERADARAAP